MNKNKTIFLLLILSAQALCSQYSDGNNSNEHQFDFWIGEWNVYKYGTDSIVGISSIRPILDHRTIEENYGSSSNKYHGKSYNIYNVRTNRWEQFWVDNSGLSLYISGQFKGNKMVLSDCASISPCNRITWTDLDDKTVRQEWEQSEDNGKKWKKVFDGHYRPKP